MFAASLVTIAIEKPHSLPPGEGLFCRVRGGGARAHIEAYLVGHMGDGGDPVDLRSVERVSEGKCIRAEIQAISEVHKRRAI